jgi:hypothetical protein
MFIWLVFFKKLLWSHFWIDFNKFYTKTFRIVYILTVYLLIMFIWVVFICTLTLFGLIFRRIYIPLKWYYFMDSSLWAIHGRSVNLEPVLIIVGYGKTTLQRYHIDVSLLKKDNLNQHTYKKISDNRRVLYDEVSIINDRCNYLRKTKSFREAGYDIVYCSFNNTMIKVVQNCGSFFGSIWLTRPLTIHNTVHWSVRHTQSFRCLLIYPFKWGNWLLRCLFLTKKGKQLFYKLLAFRR